MTDQKIIEVVTAHKEGKKIQCKCARLSNIWIDLTLEPIIWDFVDKEYRVSPASRTQMMSDEEIIQFSKPLVVAVYEKAMRRYREASSGEPTVISSTAKTSQETAPRKPREWRVCVDINGNIYQVKHQDPHHCAIVREILE